MDIFPVHRGRRRKFVSISGDPWSFDISSVKPVQI